MGFSESVPLGLAQLPTIGWSSTGGMGGEPGFHFPVSLKSFGQCRFKKYLQNDWTNHVCTIGKAAAALNQPLPALREITKR